MSELRRMHVPLARAGEVTVDGARVHYLARVLRLGVGDELEVFDGGRAFDARITALGPSTLTLALTNERAAPRSRAITVVQGLPKGDKLELVLQKATELGASAIAPVATARSIVKLEGKEAKKLERWQRIVEEAARQSRRADVPHVYPVAGLVERVASLGPETAVFVLDEEERSARLTHATSEIAAGRPCAIVVGPEGGLTREEVAALEASGAVAVSLGSLILRTETAALVALTLLRHLDGEL